MARRKKKNNGKRSKTAGDRIYDITKNVIPYVAFANQITSKDYKNDEGTGVAQQASYRNENMTTKAKIFTNIVIGRMSGYTPFKNGNLYDTENTPFTVNPSGMVNKWTTLGVAGLIYKNLGIKQLPQKQKVGAIAKRVLLSGLIGGVFDAPSAGNSTVTTMSTVRRNPSVISHNRQATLQTGMYSPSGDPTGSGFSN